ncbi:CHRD domain-containing protein [Thiohalomonas denitrificans]|uniref:CHRD domain-containing protein n=1 Tax=Thiohalomonas denitrificans TaxID=415747 RepID=A0A1G5PSN2_9GAMM|nr:CHRD domain-containing protein [Thiohalomonas denitrificans]SCZ52220.1 CHRD domain-containing protein [Thiohalomonas denitrificans]
MKQNVFAMAALLALPTMAMGQDDELRERGQEREKGEFAKFELALSEAQVVPAIESEGRGELTISFNDELSEVNYRLEVSDTNTAVTSAHLHCAPAGENGPVVVPLVTEGEEQNTFTSNDITLAGEQQEACGVPINNIASLFNAITENDIYVNVHTEAYPDGELRAQIFPEFGKSK